MARIIDKLEQHTTAKDEAYHLALRVIFHRRMWELAAPHAEGGVNRQSQLFTSQWPDLAAHAAAIGRRGRRHDGVPAGDLLQALWSRNVVGGRGALPPPLLSDRAELLLVRLIATVSSADSAEGMFEASLDRYSRRLGRDGDYFTPRAIARLMAGLAAPFAAERVLDPACGSGRLLIEAARFAHGRVDSPGEIDLSGRDNSALARDVAAMNLALNSLNADLGDGPIDSLLTTCTATGYDVVLANPPFTMADWGHDELQDDRRWVYGAPPKAQASFAWVQTALSKLSTRGRAVVLLADGAARRVQYGERRIRRALVDADVLAAVVALPPGLLPHTRLSVCLWLFCKDKSPHPAWGRTHRQQEVLFIDAQKSGRAIGRTRRHLSDNDVERICRTVSVWRDDESFGLVNDVADEPNWCRSVHRNEIAANDYDLAPATYVSVGAPARGEEDLLQSREALYECLDEADRLDRQLRSILGDM